MGLYCWTSLNAGVCALIFRHRGVAYARQEALLLGAAAAARAMSVSEDIVQVGIKTAPVTFATLSLAFLDALSGMAQVGIKQPYVLALYTCGGSGSEKTTALAF